MSVHLFVYRIFSFCNSDLTKSSSSGHLLHSPKKIEKAMFGNNKIRLIDCLGFYAISIVFQLFNGTVHKSMLSWTTFFFQPELNQSIILTLGASCSAIPIILSYQGEKPLLPDIGLSRPGNGNS